MSLADILAEIAEEEPAVVKPAAALKELPKPKQWSEDDKNKKLEFGLTRFELYHLIWETRYHLSLYQSDVEWSETKACFLKLFPRLIELWKSVSNENWYHEIDREETKNVDNQGI